MRGSRLLRNGLRKIAAAKKRTNFSLKMGTSETADSQPVQTRTVPVALAEAGRFHFADPQERSFLGDWHFVPHAGTTSGANLFAAARTLATSDTPVAFPTETVYGLGARATSGAAVRAVFAAKGRPADNPLIVHVASLRQLRELLAPARSRPDSGTDPANIDGQEDDPLPAIYRPLVRRFWPGPLTILLPLPPHSPLAREVTAGQPAFAARMPASELALALLQCAGVPVAAPSANASGRPSPTAAAHVAHDLDGRIEMIVDGGPCEIGLESTVVDGLGDVPCVLRPGGIGVEQIRRVPGWEGCVEAWREAPRTESARSGKDPTDEEWKPRAPGMKYRHYAPSAEVVLVGPPSTTGISWDELIRQRAESGETKLGILRIQDLDGGLHGLGEGTRKVSSKDTPESLPGQAPNTSSNGVPLASSNGATLNHDAQSLCRLQKFDFDYKGQSIEAWDLPIGPTTAEAARGLFGGLRELDKHGVQTILAESIQEDGEAAAAVMNRLRKAAVG